MVNHTLSTQEPEAEHLITDPAALRIYFDPTRTRILRTMVARPRTVHEVADELGVPFTRLYYHINMLEKHGLIRVVEVRSLSGAVEEKYYRVTAYRFTVDRSLLTMRTEATEVVEAAIAQQVEQVLVKTQRDVYRSARAGLIDHTQRPPHKKALLAQRGVLAMTNKRAEEFQQRLLALYAEFANDPMHATTHNYAVTVTVYPTAEDDSRFLTA